HAFHSAAASGVAEAAARATGGDTSGRSAGGASWTTPATSRTYSAMARTCGWSTAISQLGRPAVLTTASLLASSAEDDLGEEIDLGELGDGGVEDQLVDAGLLERGDHVLDGRGRAVRPAGDHLGDLGAEDAVVVKQVRPRPLLGVAEAEVVQRGDPRRPVPARVAPGGLDPL